MRIEVTKLPEVFLDRLKYIFPEKRYHELVNTFAFKKPVSFRINTAKISISEARETFSKFRIKLKPVSWYNEAFYTNNPVQKIQKLPLYLNGQIYLQRLASMVPPLVLNPKIEESILDMTAAPGSKTLQMANLMHNQGLIIAVDSDRIRADKLLYNIALQGAKNITVKMKDSTSLWNEYPECFDKILLDAPCSSETRFYINSPNTYKHWSEKFIVNSSNLQKKLIASALICLKVGGVLVYSTCSFAPEENEEVIDWVVQMVGDRIEVDTPKVKLSNLGPGVLKWRGKSYAKKVNRCIRILPNKEIEGFFVAKIRKIKKISV